MKALWARWFVTVALIWLASGCSDDVAPEVSLLEPILTGLDQPALVTAPRNREGIWIVQKAGEILALRPDGQLVTFLNLSDRVDPPAPLGWGGLSSMAFHPDFETNRYFYVCYIENSNFDVRLSRFSATPDDDFVADASSEAIILAWDRPLNAVHDVCHIEFEPSTGYLFVSLGDGTNGSPNGSDASRDLSTWAGKLLRIDIDVPSAGAETYLIPPGNPFVGVQGARPEIWDVGLRNPWRFSFDATTGDLYIADVGAANWEELNVEPTGSGGRDYGWNVLEGNECSPLEPNCNPDSLAEALDLTAPVFVYDHDLNQGRGCPAAIVGGYVYRGRLVPELRGQYVYGDYCTGGFIAALAYENGTVTNSRSLTQELGVPPGLNVSSFGLDGFGELYVVAWYGGTIYRVGSKR